MENDDSASGRQLVMSILPSGADIGAEMPAAQEKATRISGPKNSAVCEQCMRELSCSVCCGGGERPSNRSLQLLKG